MSEAEYGYLIGVVIAFGAFALSLAYASIIAHDRPE